MTHRDFIVPNGKWPSGTVPLPKRISALDASIAASLNGDDGGTWNPATPITLVSLTSTFNIDHDGQIAGGVKTQRGGRIVVSAAPIFVNGSDAAVNRTRTVFVPLMPRTATTLRVPDHVYSSAKGATISYAATGGVIDLPLPPNRLHHGGTLTTATLAWRCGQAHTNVPATQPRVDVFRANVNGTNATSVGNVSVTASTADGYYNGGLVQALAITGMTEVIDTTQYHYFLRWTEEAITNAISPSFNQLVGVTLVFASIPGTSFE